MKDIKFVSYDGSWPNLCSGDLTLEVDGVKKVFGYNNDLSRFWYSGGSTWFDEEWSGYVSDGDWVFDEYDELPDKMKEEFTESEYEIIKELFQDNVPNGCCGGCL